MKFSSLIKRVCAGVVGAGSSLIIAACYGVYYDSGLVTGRVTTQDGTPIPELRVCAVVDGNQEGCTTTSPEGDFGIYSYSDETLADAERLGLVVQVRDVDGALNGTFEDKDVSVPPGPAPAYLDITLDGTPL